MSSEKIKNKEFTSWNEWECISPHPHQYRVLAHFQMFANLGQMSLWVQFSCVLLSLREMMFKSHFLVCEPMTVKNLCIFSVVLEDWNKPLFFSDLPTITSCLGSPRPWTFFSPPSETAALCLEPFSLGPLAGSQAECAVQPLGLPSLKDHSLALPVVQR